MIDSGGLAAYCGVVVIPSLFDGRCKLHIDQTGVEAWIEFHGESLPCVRDELLSLAYARGFVEDAGGDPYDMTSYVGDGRWRTYLAFRDTRPDIPLQRGALPSLIPTAFGPLSGAFLM